MDMMSIEGLSEARSCQTGESPCRDDGDGESTDFCECPKADRDCNIEPPTSPYAIMRRDRPYRRKSRREKINEINGKGVCVPIRVPMRGGTDLGCRGPLKTAWRGSV